MEKDRLLSQELGKVGAIAGGVGGTLTGGLAAGLGGALSGSVGAMIVASFLPTEYYQKEIQLRSDPRTLLEVAYSFFTANGRLLNSADTDESQYPKLSGVVGSGYFNMNPTILHVELIATNDMQSTLLLTAQAKEGLIKQHSSEKLVARFSDAMLPYAI